MKLQRIAAGLLFLASVGLVSCASWLHEPAYQPPPVPRPAPVLAVRPLGPPSSPTMQTIEGVTAATLAGGQFAGALGLAGVPYATLVGQIATAVAEQVSEQVNIKIRDDPASTNGELLFVALASALVGGGGVLGIGKVKAKGGS